MILSVVQNMANKKLERKKKEEEAGLGKRELQKWPSELVFFLRTVELLQGICSMTGHQVCGCLCVRMLSPSISPSPPLPSVIAQLMESMTLMARRALINNIPPEQRMLTPVFPQRGAASTNPQQSWEPLLRKHLESLVKAESVLGVQVSVWQGKRVMVDVAAGKMGPLDPRPVQPNSLFPCYGVSRVATSAVVHSFVESNLVGAPLPGLHALPPLPVGCAPCVYLCLLAAYNQPVATVWAPFGVNGKNAVTVADLLKCRSGVEGALPQKVSTYTTFNVEEVDVVAAQIAERPYEVLGTCSRAHSCVVLSCLVTRVGCGECADCLLPSADMDSGPRNPQELVSYLFYGWGWAAAGFVKALTSKPIHQAVTGLYCCCPRICLAL